MIEVRAAMATIIGNGEDCEDEDACGSGDVDGDDLPRLWALMAGPKQSLAKAAGHQNTSEHQFLASSSSAAFGVSPSESLRDHHACHGR